MDAKQKIGRVAIVVLFIAISVFAYVKTRPIWHGVDIVLEGVYNGQSFDSPLVHLNGRAVHAIQLVLNGRLIAIDESGNFKESLLLPPGYSIITIEATDKFKNRTIKKFDVYNTEARKDYFQVNNIPKVNTEEIQDVAE